MSSRPKRKYVPTSKRNPKRGGPGVLLTCETGRERKCRFEGLDILNFYHRKQKATADEGDDANDSSAAVTDKKALSLDDEIKQLKTKKEKQIFSLYDTGVRGSITLLCTLPDSGLIEPFHRPKEQAGDKEEPETKKQKSDDSKVDVKSKDEKGVKVEEPKEETKPKEEKSGVKSPPLWDPVATVRLVLDDLRKGSTDAPSSRFVTRMVPIQASCFASEAEMAHVARHLFSTIAPPVAGAEPITFAIQLKRRICSHIKRQDVIDWVAKEAPSEWKVNLTDAKYTLVVEIMKTLCGMSIIENIKDYGNFNLVETREKGEEKGAETAAETAAETE